MSTLFPPPIAALPQADIPLAGAQAFLAQGEHNQILFMEFAQDVDLPEHSHGAQVGFVLEGVIEMTIDDVTQIYRKGDRYYIGEGVRHSGKIFAGYADITYFAQKDRYGIK